MTSDTPPFAGIVKVDVGACDATTVKTCGALVPLAVVTVTLSAPSVALDAIVNVAVIDVLFTTVTLPTVTPVPLTATVAPLRKLVPVSVTGTAFP